MVAGAAELLEVEDRRSCFLELLESFFLDVEFACLVLSPANEKEKRKTLKPTTYIKNKKG